MNDLPFLKMVVDLSSSQSVKLPEANGRLKAMEKISHESMIIP